MWDQHLSCRVISGADHIVHTVEYWDGHPLRVKLGEEKAACISGAFFLLYMVNIVTVDLDPHFMGVHCDQAHLLVDSLSDLAYPLTGFMDGCPVYDSSCT